MGQLLKGVMFLRFAINTFFPVGGEKMISNDDLSYELESEKFLSFALCTVNYRKNKYIYIYTDTFLVVTGMNMGWNTKKLC